MDAERYTYDSETGIAYSVVENNMVVSKDSMVRRLNSMWSMYDTLTDANSWLREQLEEATKAVDELRRQVSGLEQENEGLKRENDEVNAGRQNATSERDELEQEIEELRDRVNNETFYPEWVEQMNVIQELRDQLEGERNNYTNLREETEGIRKEIRDWIKVCDDRSSKLALCREELDEVYQAKGDLQQALEEIRGWAVKYS